jgi:hypothetical protein
MFYHILSKVTRLGKGSLTQREEERGRVVETKESIVPRLILKRGCSDATDYRGH